MLRKRSRAFFLSGVGAELSNFDSIVFTAHNKASEASDEKMWIRESELKGFKKPGARAKE